MKKFLIVIPLATLLLSGCATYNVKKGESPYNQGYVVSRYGRVIPEYTLGKDNSVPDELIAKERFERRRKEVENYYKKMGYIENRFKQSFIDPPVFMIQAVLGIFRLPAIAIKDYNYNHDPKYKEMMDKKDDAEYKAEKERLKVLRDGLNAYIQKDLQQEAPVLGPAPAPAAAESGKEIPTPKAVEAPVEGPVAAKVPVEASVEAPVADVPVVAEPPVKEAAPAVSEVKGEEKVAPVTLEVTKPEVPVKLPTAVIIAKPLKGASPLTVQFYGSKSSSPNGRIISYSWDFGDGDTSGKKNPINTYWSTTYGSRKFIAALTVKDEKGASSVASVVIEVITK